MNFSSYTDERLLNAIKQSYNFDVEIVEEAKKQVVARSLMTTQDVNALLKENEMIRFDRKAELDINFEETMLKNNNKEKANKQKRTFLNWLSVLVAIICFYLGFVTGSGLFFIIPLFSFFTAKTVSNRYFKRTINK